MSFSHMVKEELCSKETLTERAAKAEGYGMLLFGRSFSIQNISLHTEHEPTARRLANLLARTAGVYTEIRSSAAKRGGKSRFFTVTVPDENQRRQVLSVFGHRADSVSLHILRENIGPALMGDFLRGVFLACGTLVNPEKGYHLELTASFRNLTNDLLELLTELSLGPKLSVRKGGYVVYFKESEHIEDFLTLAGATNASLSIMNVKIYKNIRNRANRITNCETANIGKTVAAAVSQTEDIRLVLSKRGAESLPEELRELALLRMDNPEMSLRELGERLNPPLSRSGVNHRLRRLSLIADKLRSGEEEKTK